MLRDSWPRYFRAALLRMNVWPKLALISCFFCGTAHSDRLHRCSLLAGNTHTSPSFRYLGYIYLEWLFGVSHIFQLPSHFFWFVAVSTPLVSLQIDWRNGFYLPFILLYSPTIAEDAFTQVLSNSFTLGLILQYYMRSIRNNDCSSWTQEVKHLKLYHSPQWNLRLGISAGRIDPIANTGQPSDYVNNYSRISNVNKKLKQPVLWVSPKPRQWTEWAQ